MAIFGHAVTAWIASRSRQVIAFVAVTGLLLAGLNLVGQDSLSDGIRVPMAFGLLVVIPGLLTGELLRLRLRWSRIQSLTLSIALGIAEAVIIGRLALAFNLHTHDFALILLLLAFAKLVVLIILKNSPSVKRTAADLPLLLQLLFTLCAVYWLASGIHAIPDHADSAKSDFWVYTALETKFTTFDTQPNLQPGIFTVGTNVRLSWDSWHYLLASMMEVSGVNPVDFQQRDVLYALHIFALLTFIAVGQELFSNRYAPYMAALMQVVFMLVGTDPYYGSRLLEDKFFSLFVLIPIGYLLVLRLLEKPSRCDWILAVMVLLGIGLVHPFNPLALNATIMGFVVARAVFGRKEIPYRRALALVGLLVATIALTVLDRVAILTQPIVADAFASYNIPLNYTIAASAGWDYTRWHIYFVGCLFILLLAAFRASKDRAALFIVSVFSVILVLLWVPPFAGLFAMAVTESQNWRLFMLLPMGFVWAWFFVQVLDYVLRHVSPRLKTATVLVWCVSPLIVHLLLWLAFRYPIPWIPQPDHAINNDLWDTLTAGSPIVSSGRVATLPNLTLYVAAFWPKAILPYYSKEYTNPPAYDQINDLFNLAPDVDLAGILRDQQIDYLLIPRETPLFNFISRNWPCCTLAHESWAYDLYSVRYDISPGDVAGSDIRYPLDYDYGDIANLEGYSLEDTTRGKQVTVYWQPLQNTPVPLTVFVHLYGDTNPATGTILWAQDDHPPRLGQVDTTNWQGAGAFSDAYLLDTQGLAPGEYQIAVGMYDPEGKQVNVYDDGHRLVGDRVTIATFKVE